MQGYINGVRAYPPKIFPISAALAFPASTTLKRMLSGSSDFCGKAQADKKKNSRNVENKSTFCDPDGKNVTIQFRIDNYENGYLTIVL
jgi:hypothetical protein